MYGKVRKVSIIEYGILAICVRISNIPNNKLVKEWNLEKIISNFYN